jgi:hypothetical protein
MDKACLDPSARTLLLLRRDELSTQDRIADGKDCAAHKGERPSGLSKTEQTLYVFV